MWPGSDLMKKLRYRKGKKVQKSMEEESKEQLKKKVEMLKQIGENEGDEDLEMQVIV